MGFWKYVLGTPRNYALTKDELCEHFFMVTGEDYKINFASFGVRGFYGGNLHKLQGEI